MKWERVITVFLTAAVAMFVIFVLYHIIWWQPKPDRDSWVEKKLFVQNMSALPYNGIDLSQEQGYVDWQSVSMDRLIDFVYLKATEGSTHVDSRYMANVTAAYNYGFLIGSYHRFTSDSSVEKQFFNFNKNVEHSADGRTQRGERSRLVDAAGTGQFGAVCVARQRFLRQSAHHQDNERILRNATDSPIRGLSAFHRR